MKNKLNRDILLSVIGLVIALLGYFLFHNLIVIGAGLGFLMPSYIRLITYKYDK